MTSRRIGGIAISSGWVLVLVAPLILLGGWYVVDLAARHRADDLYRNSISACHRGNALRQQLNTTIDELRASPLPVTDCKKAYRRP